MVLAFLRAELDSRRFGGEYQLDRRTLIDAADLQSSSQNAARLHELQRVKGALLLPSGNVTWRRVAIERGDVPRLKYLNHPDWIQFSHGTRLVSEGAKNIDSNSLANDTGDHIRRIAEALGSGVTYPELIAVEEEGECSDIILTEGHARATAYILAGWPRDILCILGTSHLTHEWDIRYGQRLGVRQ
jgi:hypothetical protein